MTLFVVTWYGIRLQCGPVSIRQSPRGTQADAAGKSWDFSDSWDDMLCGDRRQLPLGICWDRCALQSFDEVRQ